MAVTKSKAYHSEAGARNAVGYIIDENKTHISIDMTEPGTKGAFPTEDIENDPELLLRNVVRYSSDPKKTSLLEDGEQLVSGIHCTPSLAVDMFRNTADAYHRNGHKENAGKVYHAPALLRAKLDASGNVIYDKDGKMMHDPNAPVFHDENGDTVMIKEQRRSRVRTCYMWVMAFPPKEVCGFDIDPRLIHHIGKEFVAEMEKSTGMEFPAVVATHVDKEHIHNHIVHSAYAMDGHHKYVDNMETLRKAREISDRLSEKYGLPVIMEPGRRSMSHDEWKLVQEGKSWKEAIREEIEYQVRHAASYQDFLDRMERSGYTVRETENHLTFVTPDKKHRARDTSLGADYVKTEIEKAFAPEKDMDTPENDPERFDVEYIEIANKEPVRIFVSRYTETGRRRSDIEMIILKAIQIIRMFMNRHSDSSPGKDPISWSAEKKLEKLRESLDILNERGLESIEQLRSEKRSAGANLSRSRAVVKDLSVSENALRDLLFMLENVKDLRDMAEKFGVPAPSPDNFTDDEIAKERARLFPQTAKMRRELYLSLKDHPEYRIIRKYDSITYQEAGDIISFLAGRSAVRPNVLITAEEYEKRREKMKYRTMRENVIDQYKERYGSIPAYDSFKEQIRAEYSIDASKLTLYDQIRYTAYMEPDVMPDVNAEPGNTATPGQIKLLKELMRSMGKTPPVGIDNLSSKDTRNIMSRLLLSDAEPECVRMIAKEQFLDSISGLTYEERGYILEYRELVNSLASLGYDMSHIDDAIIAIKAQLKQLETARKDEKYWNSEYRTLAQLESIISMAQNPHFTKGPNFDLLEPEVDERNEDGIKQEAGRVPDNGMEQDYEWDVLEQNTRDTDYFDL